MLPEYAGIMVKYSLGQATEEDFCKALMDTLIDPRWMMKWFSTEHGMSSPLADVVRRPGRELGQAMRSLVEISTRWANSLQASGLDADPTGKNGEIATQWRSMERQLLVSIAQQKANAIGIQLNGYEAEDVMVFCPGLTACIRSLYSSAWANIGEGRKEEPSDSQPVDALHALYAPYVQIFRADRFMAPHIQKQVASTKTLVVPRAYSGERDR